MNVCILGWYGTETLGDRAILDGIFTVFSRTYKAFNISIGSLLPFLTYRTILEDGDIYHNNSPGMRLSCFDVKNPYSLKAEIDKSDIVLMGGGPLMDLDELNIIAYAFKLAKKRKKKTMIFGCGLGPLLEQQYIEITEKLFSYSDIIIFRDELSCDFARELYGFKIGREFLVANDPAVISVGTYLNNRSITAENYNIAVNFREYPNCFKSDSHLSDIRCRDIILNLASQFDTVLLVPMHTFCVGGDDRYFLTKISNNIDSNNVKVLHKPLNLHELYNVYSSAYGCVGMRYHSIVFQTLLNGNNYIIDYTQPNKGKTCGFLQMIGANQFYRYRYWNIHSYSDNHSSIDDISNILIAKCKFEYNDDIFEDTISFYTELIK